MSVVAAAMLWAAVASGAAAEGSRAAPPVQGATGGGSCPPVSASLVKEGSQVFSGQGNCFTCHGISGIGTALAPDLMRGHKWLVIGGTYQDIADLIKKGVPHPTKPFSMSMPPEGGASLSAEQVCAVAAYVNSITHNAGASK